MAVSSAAQSHRRLQVVDRLPLLLIGGFLACLSLLEVRIKAVGGLPAHPLLLHFPVVLVPALSAATIALTMRQEWWSRYRVALAVLGLVALATTILAADAGEAFRESSPAFEIPALDEHARLGEQLKFLMVFFSGSIVALVSLDKGRLSIYRKRPLSGLMRFGLSLLSILALVWVVRTGHEGAKVTFGQLAALRAMAPWP